MNKLTKIYYILFPSKMPKVWITDKKSGITYRYNQRIDAFVGSNNVVVGLGYVIKNYTPVK